jgi:8-oxo-dGTP pyrophosphatase MutT (NUDIX family)
LVVTRQRKQKVVCYIVRDGHLLVFKDLDEWWDESGLHVPAGGMQRGESPEVAAIWEASEETGLTALRLVRKVGRASTTWLPTDRG